jgi:polyphosphate kinase
MTRDQAACYFENGGTPEVYIGSADLMDRNLDRRVETLCRLADRDLATHLREVVLEAYLRDNTRACVLVDDVYQRSAPQTGKPGVDAQQRLLDWYRSHPPVVIDQDAR